MADFILGPEIARFALSARSTVVSQPASVRSYSKVVSGYELDF
jgi:hypothetical protein